MSLGIEDIEKIIKDNDVEFIRLQFTDMLGHMKNVAVPKSQLENALNNKITFDGMGTAYIELHVEYSHVIGVVLIQGASQPAYVMPSLQDMRDGVFDFDGSDKAGRLGDGTVLGTSPILSFP